MNHAVVMAGGSGTRFWPESRMRRSKQFLDLTGDGPMVVETVRRLLPLVPRENVWVVAGEKDGPHLKPRALGVPAGNILLEPEGRNTTPAVALAAACIERRDVDAVIAATPADHAVADAASFRSTLARGFRLARRTGRFVTLGIAPTHPATGYGYIERGAPFREGGKGVYRVRRFTEKPDLRAARKFLRSGRFYWNSGVFIVRSSTYRNRMAGFLPSVHRELEQALGGGGKTGLPVRLRRAYARIPSISVDYGILEKEEGILVIPAEFAWNDIGTWRSLHDFLGKAGENVAAGNVILSDCRGTFVRSDRGVVAVIGMEDVVIVHHENAVLVCPRHRSEEVKGIAEEVQRRFPELA
ncbi:MAG TPA: sugar phosphate nucleotidyltransferase [Candidatus Deferrimicrobiaceae bacterium]|nr:sugar phosphate nucleotidyltransferase [Candidatus Deferrimicrobiaceae bacterium]